MTEMTADQVYATCPELGALQEFEVSFQERFGRVHYAPGFELQPGDYLGLRTGWSDDQAFIRRLVPLGSANGSGSFYALWRADNHSDLAAIPAVAPALLSCRGTPSPEAGNVFRDRSAQAGGMTSLLARHDDGCQAEHPCERDAGGRP